MDMLSYLISLVKTSKEVGIPGIGTIYKKKSPGRYDVQTHSFLPPSYTLAFSEELAESYSLTEFVARKRNISVAAATYFVEQFSEEINKQLDNHHEASLGALGTLHNHSGTLTFSSGDAAEFGFEYYGLPAIKDEVWSAADAEPAQQEPAEQTEKPRTEQLELENSNADVTDGHSDESTEQSTAGVASTEAEPAFADRVVATEPISDMHSTVVTPIHDTKVGETQISENQFNEKINGDIEADQTPNDKTVVDEHLNDQQLNYQQPADQTSTEDVPNEEEAVYEEITELGLPEKVALIIPLPEIETPEGVEHIEDHAHLHVSTLHQSGNSRPTLNETLAQAAATAPVLDEPAGHVETETPPVYYHLEEEAPEKTGMPWYLKVIIALLVIAIAAAATYVLKPELFENLLYKNETEQPQLSNQALQKTADSIATADSIKQSIEAAMLADSLKKDSLPATGIAAQPGQKVTSTEQAAIEKKAAEQKAAEQKAIEKTIAAPTTVPQPETLPAGTTFEVIGSSLSSQKEADRFLAQMKKAGIKAKAFPGKKVIRISIATFKDDKTARAAIPALKEKLGINGLYVYTNKPE